MAVETIALYFIMGMLPIDQILLRIIEEIQPDEIYNLAAQSHVRVSFETPEYTANADAIGYVTNFWRRLK